MFKKLLSLFLIAGLPFLLIAQPITVSNITTTGKLNECAGSAPIVSVTYLAGPGSNVSGGVLNCTDPCDTTQLLIQMSNLKWNQGPDVNWVHGVYFPGATGFTFETTTLAPLNWVYTSTGCTGTQTGGCGGNLGTHGGPGWYYQGTSPGCCPGGGTTATPCDNWGDGTITCTNPMAFNFTCRICNNILTTGGLYFFRLRIDCDGNTGCWAIGNPEVNLLTFAIAVSPCGNLYPSSSATAPALSCSPTPMYTSIFNATCGNSSTVTWWTAATGGTQVGTGSPFTYTSATCPSGTTLYAACCAVGGPDCANRHPVGIPNVPVCATVVSISGTTITQPTCTVPTGGVTVNTSGGSGGTYTYTISPGGTSNTTGVFGGLSPGGYTITVTDGTCSASTSVTINPGTTGGPGPTVVTPVTYCVGAAAVPLTAPGTGLMWYTVATGGVGSATAPTPSTATAGTTSYWVSQNPTGSCESLRSQIDVIVTDNSTITLTSAATTNNQTVCVNNAITNIVYTTGSGATGATITGLPAGVTGTYSGGTNGTVTISGTPTVTGPFTYTINTTGGCGVATATGTITVNTASTMVLTSAAATTSQTLCINTAITDIVYTTGGAVTGATVGGLPAGVTGVYSGGTNGTVTISGSPSAAGTFNYTVTTSGGCGIVTLNGTIIVNPNTMLTLTSAASTTSQTPCINTAITDITYATTGGVTNVVISGLPAGVTGTYSGGTNGTVLITGTPTVSGPFTYTVTTSGGCLVQSLTGTITISPSVTLTLTSAAATTTQTLCIGTPITTIVYTTGGGATGATVTGLPAGVTGTYSGGTNGTMTITGNPTLAGMYSYTVTATGGCTNPALTGTITVNPNVTLTLTSAAATTSQTVCINTPIVDITYSTANGTTGATITGLPAGVTGSYSGGTNGTILITGSPSAAGPFTYTVTTSGGCVPPTATGTITVNTASTIVLTSAATTTSQTVCINIPIVNIVYTTGGGVTGATITGLPTGVTGVYSGGTDGTVTISGTPSVAGPYSYTVTTIGTCGTPALSGTINVNPNVTLTLTSAATTTTQTLCITTAIATITYQTANGATGATVTGLPAGVTGVYSGGTDGTVTISGNPTASGPFTYTVTTSGGCTNPFLTGTINVNPNVTMVLTSAPATSNQTVTINTAIADIVYTTGSGATGVTVSGLPTGVTGTYAGGVFTISGTPTIPGSYPYMVTSNGGCSPITLNGTINVNDLTGIVLTSAAGTDAQILCMNATLVNITYALSGGATGASITTGTLPAGVTGSYSGGINGIYTISGSPTVSGVFNYTISSSGGVGTASISGGITVNQDVTMVLTSATPTASQTVCINTAITNIVYSTGNGVTGAVFTNLPAGVTGSYSGGTNGTVTISGTPTVSGPFMYTVATTGGCNTVTLGGNINVTANPTLTLTSAAGTDAQTVCINTAITDIVYTGSNVSFPSVTGLPAGVTSSITGLNITITGTPTVAGVYNYTVSLNTCSPATITGTITVNPVSTIVLTSAAATTSQNICINMPITNIVYTTGGSATGATVTGLPTGVTGTYSGGTNGTVTISGTPIVSGPFNYTVTTISPCGTPALNGTITVTPVPTITLSSAAGTDAQTDCVNSPITDITYTLSDILFSSVTGLPPGVTASAAGSTVTITGTPNTTGVFTYTVRTNLTNVCGPTLQTGTITVIPISTIALTSAATTTTQSLCVNMPITDIVYTTGGSVTGATVSGLPTGVTGVYSGGANGTVTISGTPIVSGPFSYTVTTISPCGTPALGGTITVNPAMTVTLTSAPTTTSQTVCITAGIVDITYSTANGVTGATVTGLPTGVTGVYSGGTDGTITISGSPSVSGPFSYTVDVSGGCGTASGTGTITVNDNVTIALTSAATTAAQSICINSLLDDIVYTTTNGATGATVTPLPAGLSGTFVGGVFTIHGSPTVSGSFNYTVTTTGGCSSASLSGTIDVNPAVTMTLTSTVATTSQTICINSLLTDIVYTTANGATGATVTTLPAGLTGTYSGGTNGTFTISGTPTASGPFTYTVTTSGGCGSAMLGGTITVNPDVTLTLSSATASPTSCINMPMPDIVFTTANGVTGATTTGLPAGVTGTLTGTTYTIGGTPSAAGPFAYTVTTSGGCSTATQSGTITVNPAVTISLTSAAATTTQTICINTLLTDIVYTTANGATGATVTTLPAGVTGTYSGGTNGTFTISGTPTVSGAPVSYTVTTSGGCGSASLGGIITVNPAATLNLTSVASTAAQTVCINSAINNIVYSTANGVTNVNITGLPPGVSGTFAGTSLIINGIPTLAGSYSYTVTTVGGCGTATQSGTITVNDNVTIALTSAASTTSQTVCINTAINDIVYTTAVGATGASATGLPTGVTGNWVANVFTINGIPTTAGTYNYTVMTTGGCSSASLTGSITVTPAATITLTSTAATTSQTVCINTAINDIVYTTANGATGASTTGLPTGVTGNWVANVYTISGIPTTAGTYNYTVSTSGGCGTAMLSGSIVVNPDMTIALSSAATTSPQTVCINTAITDITYAVGNATGASVTGLPAGVSGSYGAGVFTLTGSPTATGTFNFTVTATGGCGTATINGSITVTPNVTMTLTSTSATTNQTICNNTAITDIVYTTGNGATGATVTGLPAGVTGSYAGNVFTITGTATASGTFNYMVTTTGGCSFVSLNGTIQVVAIPAAPGVVSPVVYCPNDAATPLTATGTNLLWYTAATGGTGSTTAPVPSTAIPGNTNYYVSQTSTTGGCESLRAQVVVTVNSVLSVYIGIDTTICEGDTVHFIPVVVPAASSYAWRSLTPGVPNSTISSLNTLETTVKPVNTVEYELRANAGGCSASDTVKVNVRWKPIVDAGANAAICLHDSTFLSASVTHTTGTTGITYAWTPTDSLTRTDTLQTWAHPVVTTWYKLTATTTNDPAGYGCNFAVFDSVKVVVQPVIQAFAGNDTIAMSGVPHQLHGTGGAYYTWSSPTATINNPNSQNATSILTGDANFFLKVQDAIGCTGYDSVFVKLLDGPTFYVPTAFTPDGDGLNDILRPIPSGISTMTYFRVFNRYGELMFETTQYLKGWDGTYKGKPQPSGTYVWMVSGLSRFNKTVTMKGTTMIIR